MVSVTPTSRFREPLAPEPISSILKAMIQLIAINRASEFFGIHLNRQSEVAVASNWSFDVVSWLRGSNMQQNPEFSMTRTRILGNKSVSGLCDWLLPTVLAALLTGW